MAQPFPTHPGMAVPHGGQPMAHGHPSNQGVPGGQQPGMSMGQQMHPGISGPGAQVSPAGPMMGAIMQGAVPQGVSGPGPSQHALSHLNPHHGQPMFAHQQQQHAQHACKFYPLPASLSCGFLYGGPRYALPRGEPSTVNSAARFARIIFQEASFLRVLEEAEQHIYSYCNPCA